MKNVVFFPASDEIRSSILELGLEFYSTKLLQNSGYMVVTDQMGLAQDLAKHHSITRFYVSDNQRQTFRLDLNAGSYKPTKLGTLKRATSQEGSGDNTGTFFLSIEEDNKTYIYVCK